MTATDRLRQLLDERGVEWHGVEDSTYWGEVLLTRRDGSDPVYKFRAHKTATNKLSVHLLQVTPEQAVEATLGRGTCKMKRVEDEQRILHGWLECSECGPVYPPVNDGIAQAVAFCPFCGRKVVE